MARFCSVMHKGVQVGNHVSHANNKTKRRFLPNLQQASFWSDSLKQRIRLRLSVHGIRTIEHRGGLDAFLRSTPNAELPSSLRAVKARLSV